MYLLTNLNKLDDPNATQKDKAVDISKAVTAAVTGFIPNPIIIANTIIDTASYLTDFQEGRKDTQPKPVRNFVSNFGDGPGIF
jgi:hypothetical protein